MATATTRKKIRKKGGRRDGAGRPPIPDARTERIAVRFTKPEMAKILRDANGVPLSEWVRGRVLGLKLAKD